MQKEEKQLDNSLNEIILKVQDLKNSIATFLLKLENEYETLSWPSVLDSFALLSGQLNSLSRLLKSDKVPLLRNYDLFPILLSQERDPELEKLTERRVLACTHEVIPDYLRTKPEPDVEEKTQQLLQKASSTTPENVSKQLMALNKITSNTLDIINAARDDWEKESGQKTTQPQTSSLNETQALIAAINYGKGLRTRRPETPQLQTQAAGQPQQTQPKSVGVGGKAQSSIRTNIKAASTVHPYQRT